MKAAPICVANRDLADVVIERLTALGERVNRWRRTTRGERGDRQSLPTLVEAALDHLRETLGKKLEDDAEAEASLVEILRPAPDAELRRRQLKRAKPASRQRCMTPPACVRFPGDGVPDAEKRAGMRRSAGRTLNSLKNSGGFGRRSLSIPSTRLMIRF